METKTCTTCKFEPEWVLMECSNDEFYGHCKRLPDFMKLGVWLYREVKVAEISCQTNEFQESVVFTDCSLWEEKQ